MDRRSFITRLGTLALVPAVGRVAMDPPALLALGRGTFEAGGDWEPLEKTDEEWRRILTEEEFEILRDEGTEPAFSSPLNEEHRDGTFICAGCYLPLFRSDEKFMSGTGWPSFTRPLEGNTSTKLDFQLLAVRTEYHCARCEGHQGHVFQDGPPPTGERWCNNGLALDFVPMDEELPELRS